MTPQQQIILEHLDRACGQYVKVVEILDVIGHEDSYKSRQVLRAQISKMRRELAASGKTIEGYRGQWSIGYRLVQSRRSSGSLDYIEAAEEAIDVGTISIPDDRICEVVGCTNKATCIIYPLAGFTFVCDEHLS